MSQSLVKNLLHLVYSTKNRALWLPADVRPRLFAYRAGIFKEWDSPAIIIGGVDDHVHALFMLSKNHPLKKIVEEVKKSSSKWMKNGNWKRRIPLAKWLCGVFRERVERGTCKTIHTQPGAASS